MKKHGKILAFHLLHVSVIAPVLVFLVITLCMAISLGSLWILDGIHLAQVDPSDGMIYRRAKDILQDAYTDDVHNKMASMRFDDLDFSVYPMISGGFHVRKGTFDIDTMPLDTLILIFDESRAIPSRGNLYTGRVRPMHTGITIGGARVRLCVAEFEAMDLSEFVYRPLSSDAN